jgi:hypothetical protein
MSPDISPVPDGKIVYDLYGGYIKPMLLRLAHCRPADSSTSGPDLQAFIEHSQVADTTR